MELWKIVLLAVAILLVLLLVIALMVGWSYTHRVERSPQQAQFRAGTVPSELPDGQYNGTSSDLETKGWHGKTFDRAKATGLNRIGDELKYPFVMSKAKGLRDPIDVVLIDYNLPGNPWWLRLVRDEIVEISPNHFLGKVHVHILGMTFSVGYFELQK